MKSVVVCIRVTSMPRPVGVAVQATRCTVCNSECWVLESSLAAATEFGIYEIRCDACFVDLCKSRTAMLVASQTEAQLSDLATMQANMN